MLYCISVYLVYLVFLVFWYSILYIWYFWYSWYSGIFYTVFMWYFWYCVLYIWYFWYYLSVFCVVSVVSVSFLCSSVLFLCSLVFLSLCYVRGFSVSASVLCQCFLCLLLCYPVCSLWHVNVSVVCCWCLLLWLCYPCVLFCVLFCIVTLLYRINYPARNCNNDVFLGSFPGAIM